MVLLAADYGWGPQTLLLLFVVIVICSTVAFFIVALTTRMKKKQSFAHKRTYKLESYWAIGTAIILIWLWITSYPWMPPVSFSSVQKLNSNDLQIVKITAGQWFWLVSNDNRTGDTAAPSTIRLDTNKPVKFIARSIDVSHGFGIFESKDDGSPILLQMQIVPGFDNIFYYTFTKPGTYFVRCLEYCGYGHPYMTSSIEVVDDHGTSNSHIRSNNVSNSSISNVSYPFSSEHSQNSDQSISRKSFYSENAEFNIVYLTT